MEDFLAKRAELVKKYSEYKSGYESLASNLVSALTLLLKSDDLKVLSIESRIKAEDSVIGKAWRKKYDDPFDEIEDFCGIRIICYYQSDLDKIGRLISKELEVIESQDKENLLQTDQFGYRSVHYIVRIKKNWLQAPNYRGLENLKAEIQVRTVLMHAWAEIEHKLSYKKDSHIPKQFKRTFSRLSAKLEEADEQFENLKNEITNYRQAVVRVAKQNTLESEEIELNLDSLQAFLDTAFPDRKRLTGETPVLLDEMIKVGASLRDLQAGYEATKEFLVEIEMEERGEIGWVQVGLARVILDLTHEAYRDARFGAGRYAHWVERINRARKVPE
jgi:putative GTP pyrophosphokinase